MIIFGEFWPLWQNFKVLINFWSCLFYNRPNFETNWAKFMPLGSISMRIFAVGKFWKDQLVALFLTWLEIRKKNLDNSKNDENNKWDSMALNSFLTKWANPSLVYCLFSVFSNKHPYKFYNKLMWKMCIQYTVPGFKPTTFGTWVSSHYH